MRKSVILFDLDGTITDPGLGITNSILYALSRMGIDAPPREELYSFIGPPLLDSFQRFYGFDARKAQEAVDHYRVYFSNTGIFENAVLDGALDEIIDALRTADEAEKLRRSAES